MAIADYSGYLREDFEQSGLDINNGGHYRIASTIDELGILGSYKVVLFQRDSAMPVAVTVSGEDGSYSFENLRHQYYFAVGFDHGDNPVAADVADYLLPEPMA